MGTTWDWSAPVPAVTGSKSERGDRSSLGQAEAQECQSGHSNHTAKRTTELGLKTSLLSPIVPEPQFMSFKGWGGVGRVIAPSQRI